MRVSQFTFLPTVAALGAVLVPISPTAAYAQDAGAASVEPAAASRTTRFPAEFYATFAPTTALDIVRRTPGFVLEESDGEVRGFGAAAGNVVINGARPSAKSESLSAVLARIPARRVLHVEVGPGDLFGTDYSGKSQVANITLSQEGGVDGNVKATLTRLYEGTLIPDIQAAALIRSGPSSFNLSAGSGRNGQYEVGFDDLRRIADGVRIELREKANTIRNRDPFAAASWGYDGGDRRTANLGLRYAQAARTLDQTNQVIPATGSVRDDLLNQDFRSDIFEFSGDVTRPLGQGTVKLVLLGNRRERENFDSTNNRISGAIIGGFEQTQVSRYDEAIGRISLAQPDILGFSTELGAELAYNQLDNATTLFLLGANGARTRVALPISTAQVGEWRTESYFNFGRSVASGLRFDATLAFETSKLTVSGDTAARRSLQFFKPGVTLDWKGGDGWHVQAAARREVAQLDFFDFLSSAELHNERVNGGNANLVPQRSWEMRLTVERPVLGKGLVKLDLGHDRVSALQDRILTPDGFDAPGNLGSGTRNFANLTFDAPLDTMGLSATRIKIETGWQDSRVLDPLSSRTRPWSGFQSGWTYSVDLRRDSGQWSYGATISEFGRNTTFRINEVDSFGFSDPFATAFVEYRPDRRTTVRFQADNLLERRVRRYRDFFAPNRMAALPTINEVRDRSTHVGLILSINRTFGSG